MPLQHHTHQQQSKLAAYCRTDELAGDLLVMKDRVYHYRRLVYNVIDDSLRSAFPLTANLLEESELYRLVNDFFADHKAQSPQVWKLAGEFFGYWKSNPHALMEKHPFLPDLLAFEWIEIEVFMMEDIPYPDAADNGDYLVDLVVFNPEHRIIRVEYPVHIKNAKHITSADKKDHYILVYREKELGKVQFIDMSAYLTLVIENMINGLTLSTILNELKKQVNDNDLEELSKNTLQFLHTLKTKKFILGYLD